MDDNTTLRNNPMNILRRIVNLNITNHGMTWYRLAEETGIRHHSLYRFRDGGGLDGENTIQLMAYFKLNPEDLL